MKIGGFDIKRNVLLIAEIGNNHEGNLDVAEELIYKAAESGANAVKFQSIDPYKLVSPKEKKRIKQLKKFQISLEDHFRLKKVADKNKVIFLSTPFSIEAVEFLDSLVPAYKIASSDNNYFKLIECIAQKKKPILLSTGMTNMKEISLTVKKIKEVSKKIKKNPELVLLQCVSSYPTKEKFANLATIKTLSSLGFTVGYSDHTIGIEAAVLSVGLGARVIEKHFTLSKNYSEFRDHKLSAEPEEFKELAERVKNANLLLGNGEKKIQECEKSTFKVARRSICVAIDMKKGDKLSAENLICLRPGNGVPPGTEKKIVGKRLLKNLKAGEKIKTSILE